jgi:hypothetical protein
VCPVGFISGTPSRSCIIVIIDTTALQKKNFLQLRTARRGRALRVYDTLLLPITV